MTTVDYAALAAEALRQNTSLITANDANFRGLALYFALYAEALQAARQIRQVQGTLVDVRPWTISDRFDIRLNGRAVSFERERGRAQVAMLVDDTWADNLEAASLEDTLELARTNVGAAIGLVLKNG